jgi:hypothetical protein
VIWAISLSVLAAGNDQQIWLGVVVEPTVLGGTKCARVVAVVPSSPADGKVRAGDCIVRLGSEAVSDLDTLTATYQHHRVGESVELVLRSGSRISIRYERLPPDARERTCHAAAQAVARVVTSVEGGVTEERIELRPGARVSELRERVRGAAVMPYVLVDRPTSCDGSRSEPILAASDATRLVDGDRVSSSRPARCRARRALGATAVFAATERCSSITHRSAVTTPSSRRSCGARG